MAPKRAITPEDITTLRDLLSSTEAKILSPDDEGYSDTILRWSRAAEKPAGASLVPTSSEAISIAVKFATSKGIDVAVKGGGHSTAGASSTDGGLLIDLSSMRKVTVNYNSKTITVQGGATWGDVDTEADNHGLATVGGTVNDTGVGGLTLGGGFGWLSGVHGLVIDNLISCEMVLADGTIKRINSTDEPDLFWAIRGAGQNFGVATEFTFQGHDSPQMYTGMIMFPPVPEIVRKVVDAWNTLFTRGEDGQTKGHGKLMGGLAWIKPPPTHDALLMVLVNFIGTEEEGNKILAPILEAGPVFSNLSMKSYAEANRLLQAPIGGRASMKGVAFEIPLRADFVLETFEQYQKFTTDIPEAAGTVIMWEMMDATKVVSIAGNDEAGFANRGWHMNGVVMPFWSDKAKDAACRQWARDMADKFREELIRDGVEPGRGVEGGVGKRGDHGAVMLYGNYDQYDEKSRDIFGFNYPRLQELKAKYDPTNTFNKLFPIDPQK
ncbi:FAD binding domain-containing protein [Patellaria atrata CBS 101060]|uniref:FAD binding domain-containing protein n=1 Tax=Patellaria atrata CBS 101060 TaxID=1346257 RepID=A0A9P4SGL5_9PEZI|nr:FAD binding domain-containing protein [Patellaria atrata CBS 101060]